MSGTVGEPAPDPAPRADSRRRRAVLAGAGAAAAVAAVALGLALGGDPEPGAEPAPTPSASPERSAGTPASGATGPGPDAVEPGAGEPGAGEAPPPEQPQPEPGTPDGEVDPQPAPPPDGAAGLPPLGTTPPEVVTLDAPAPVAGSAQARVLSVEGITAEASGIGEIGGPAMLVTLEVDNPGAAPVALGSFSVSAYLGDAAVPASPVSSDERHAPLTGELAPGATARGAYVFSLRGDPGGVVSVSVLSGTDGPQVVFQGPRPGSLG